MGAIVYCVTNLANGKRYIGATRFNLGKRWGEHKTIARAGTRKTPFYRALRKYGIDNFKIEQVASCLGESVENWSVVEQDVIKSMQPEYNRTNGVEITKGKRVPRETIDRIIAKNTGKKRTPEQNKANSERARLRMQDPLIKEKYVATLRLNHARRHEWEERRLESCRKSAAEGKYSHKLSDGQKARQLANMTTPEARAKMAASKCKPVLCVTTGEIFKSMLEASEKTNIPFPSISKVCLGRRNSVYGKVFKYI